MGPSEEVVKKICWEEEDMVFWQWIVEGFDYGCMFGRALKTRCLWFLKFGRLLCLVK